MTKQDALELFGFDIEPEANEVQIRKTQLNAFFSCGENEHISHLSKRISEKIDSASLVLSSGTEADKSDKPDIYTESEQQESKDKPKEKVDKIKAASESILLTLLFPEPLESAGAVLSDKWWRVYKRTVLLALALIGAAFLIGPQILPRPEPKRSDRPERSYEKLYPNSPNDETYRPVRKSSPGDVLAPPELTPELKQELNPLPNPQPAVITPTQSAKNFMLSLFSSIQSGNNLNTLIAQPATQSVEDMLARSHRLVNFANLPEDALSIVSESGGNAVVRVQECYFTTGNEINDYYLKSDNGVWKLSEIKEAPAP